VTSSDVMKRHRRSGMPRKSGSIPGARDDKARSLGRTSSHSSSVFSKASTVQREARVTVQPYMTSATRTIRWFLDLPQGM
jgi:hypothetical protein